MIKDKMVSYFNEMMVDEECPLRICKVPHNDYSYEINVVRHRFVKNKPLVTPTNEFYDLLNRHFESYGVLLSYDNTGTTFWSR